MADLGKFLGEHAGKTNITEPFAINLAGVDYISSDPLRLLVQADRILREEGRPGLIVINPSPRVGEILELCKLTHLLIPPSEKKFTT